MSIMHTGLIVRVVDLRQEKMLSAFIVRNMTFESDLNKNEKYGQRSLILL